MRYISRQALIIIVVVIGLAIPAFAFAQVAGLRVEDSVSHINHLALGRVNMESSQVVLTKGLDLRSGQTALISDIDVASLFAHVRIMGYSVDSYALTVAGSLKNNSHCAALMNFYIEVGRKGLDRGERRFIGTILVKGGQEKEITPSSYFQAKLWEQLAIVATEEDDQIVPLYVQMVSKGSCDARVRIDELALKQAPIYHSSTLIHNNPNSTYPAHANIAKVALAGSFENRGEKELRVVMAAGIEDMFGEMDFSEGVFVDGIVQPGETINARDMILDGALVRLSEAMSEATFGMPIEMHMFIFSADGIDARIQDIKIITEVSYR